MYSQSYVQPQQLGTHPVGTGAGVGCGCHWTLSWQPRAELGLPVQGAAQEDFSGFWDLRWFVLTGIDHAALALFV